jgi:hypothetical protein
MVRRINAIGFSRERDEEVRFTMAVDWSLIETEFSIALTAEGQEIFWGWGDLFEAEELWRQRGLPAAPRVTRRL